MNMMFLPMAFDIGSFLQNSTETLKTWGGYFVILLGVVAVVWAVYRTVKGLIQSDRGQTNWFIVAAAFILGGALIAGGWNFVSTISEGGQKTIMDLGQTILPCMFAKF